MFCIFLFLGKEDVEGERMGLFCSGEEEMALGVIVIEGPIGEGEESIHFG